MNCQLICYVDDTLWTGVPGNYTDPDAPEALSQVRELVDKGQYADATEAANKLFGNLPEVWLCFWIIYQ